MTGTRGAKWLTSAVIVPLLAALLLPASFGVVICRFGGMTVAHGCCAGGDGAQASPDPGTRIEDEGCCSWRAVELGTPLAEQVARAEHVRDCAAAEPWIAWVDRPGRHAGEVAIFAPPAIRALGPPVRLLKQSFLL